MSVATAWAFAAFAFVAAITPGPSNVMLTALGASAGIRGGLPAVFGVAAGVAGMMFAVTLGLGALIVAEPALLAALKWCGIAFLLWLAWKIASSPPSAGEPSSPKPVGFIGAALLQWLNPKPWLVCTGAATAYMTPGSPPLVQATWLAGIFCVIALGASFAWLAFGVGMRRLLGTARRQRAFNLAMALLLAASVVFIL